jgi:hypothetical protein
MKYGKRYPKFKCLLLYFLVYGEEKEPTLNDKEIINLYVSNFNSEYIKQTLDEAKEVLKLNPLPEDWIWDIAGGHARPWPDDNIESCKQWIEWIIKKLENQCRLYKKEPNEAMNIIMRNK